MEKKLDFTERAKKQIIKITQSDNEKKYFRIEVKGGGCSGFKYNFSFDDQIKENDVLFEKTVIDKISFFVIFPFISCNFCSKTTSLFKPGFLI